MIVQQFNHALSVVRNYSACIWAVEVATEVADFAIVYLPTIRQLGFFLIGGSDFYRGIRNAVQKWHLIGTDQKVSRAFWGFLGGSTLLAAGCCGVAASIDTLVKGGRASPYDQKLFAVSNGFFFAASLIGLGNNILDLNSAETDAAKTNATIGIAAHIDYIAAATLMIAGGAPTLIVSLCCLGTSISLIQMAHGYFSR